MPPKRKSKKSTLSKLDEQYSIDNDQDRNSEEEIQVKRQVKKRGSKKTLSKKNDSKNDSKSDMSDYESENQVFDIKKGDKFIKQHIRPEFLRRWDGESNELEITEDEIDGMSPMMQIYWKKKSQNMKSLIFVQIGKSDFHCFEDDAKKIANIYQKQLRTFAGFLMCWCFYTEIPKIKEELFSRGIPVMMLNEVYDPKYKEENKLIRRQITQVITPSLYLTLEPRSYRQRILLSIHKGFNEGESFGIVALEAQTNHFYTEQLTGVSSFHEVRRIINRYRPVQLILPKRGFLNKQIKQIAKGICNPFTLEINQVNKPINFMLQEMQELNTSSYFEFITQKHQKQSEKEQKFSMQQTVMSLHLLLTYLKNLNMENKIFGQGIFQTTCFRKSKSKPMFDAQVYENLQIFRLKNQQDGNEKPGTLYFYLNECMTNSGKKLLSRWVDEPLRYQQPIEDRQSAITELLKNNSNANFCGQLHQKFIAFEKLEKGLAQIYHWVLQKNEEGQLKLTRNLRFEKDYNQNKNPAVVKLKEVYRILNLLKESEKLLRHFSELQFQSSLMNKITNIQQISHEKLINMTADEVYGLNGIPSIEQLCKFIQQNFTYEQKTGYIQPSEGSCETYDNEKQKIQQIQTKLDQELSKWKKTLGVNKISYVSVRARNQIQIPKGSLKGKKYKELIYSSQTAKDERYTTSITNQLTEQLIEHEKELAKTYQPFLNAMVLDFCKYKYIWDLYVRNIAQLDVLLGLTKVAEKMDTKCLPKFCQDGIKIVDGVHVGLKQIIEDVVPSTLILDDTERALLLTGPNMGGKSTLLRQTCLLAIMAQIGSYVPAKQYECAIFDQMFCRIGASDRMLENKSTFYVELEETQRILSQATPESLVIIDQLGRGTSTYDGMAIADSTLRHLLEQTFSYSLFSTHYTPITQWFVGDQTVKCQKMGYVIEENNEKGQNGESLKFTYQLEPGVAEKSFANNVAKMVGIPQEIMKIASIRSKQIILQDEIAEEETLCHLMNDMKISDDMPQSKMSNKMDIQ